MGLTLSQRLAEALGTDGQLDHGAGRVCHLVLINVSELDGGDCLLTYLDLDCDRDTRVRVDRSLVEKAVTRRGLELT